MTSFWTTCAVEGCTNGAVDSGERFPTCCACRTKIEDGELVILPELDCREALNNLFGGFLLLVLFLLAPALSGYIDAGGGVR